MGLRGGIRGFVGVNAWLGMSSCGVVSCGVVQSGYFEAAEGVRIGWTARRCEHVWDMVILRAFGA